MHTYIVVSDDADDIDATLKGAVGNDSAGCGIMQMSKNIEHISSHQMLDRQMEIARRGVGIDCRGKTRGRFRSTQMSAKLNFGVLRNEKNEEPRHFGNGILTYETALSIKLLTLRQENIL